LKVILVVIGTCAPGRLPGQKPGAIEQAKTAIINNESRRPGLVGFSLEKGPNSITLLWISLEVFRNRLPPTCGNRLINAD
jgi:hypothetical protein